MSTKKTEHIAVFYEGQDDLINILATSLVSICSNTQSFIDFYILDCGINEGNKRLLTSLREKFTNFSLTYLPINLGQFAGLRGYREQNFLDCYARLLIPELVPNLKKAIYLDTDTIALGDIKTLWDEDLNGCSLGGVADLGYRKIFQKHFEQDLGGNPAQVFISGGLFVIDCKRWRQKKITSALLNLAKQKKEHLLFIIEDLFSLYFTTDFKLLDSRYGFIETDNNVEAIPVEKITPEYLADEFKQAIVVHFAGPNKVWQNVRSFYTGKTIGYFDNFWAYAAQTPFYAGMRLRFEKHLTEASQNKSGTKESWRLFGIFSLLKIIYKKNTVRYKLFGFLPILKKQIKKSKG